LIGIYAPNDRLKEMVRSGIPVAFRAIVWQKISQSDLYAAQFPPDYYLKLLQSLESGALDEKIAGEIDRDINR